MNFILPSHFAEAMDSLRAIFKVKGDTKVSLLAQERVSRAKENDDSVRFAPAKGPSG